MIGALCFHCVQSNQIFVENKCFYYIELRVSSTQLYNIVPSLQICLSCFHFFSNSQIIYRFHIEHLVTQLYFNPEQLQTNPIQLIQLQRITFYYNTIYYHLQHHLINQTTKYFRRNNNQTIQPTIYKLKLQQHG